MVKPILKMSVTPMKEYVSFRLVGKKPRTNVYAVHSKSDNDYLGDIYWHVPWRQYVFDAQGILLSRSCMAHITRFIDGLMSAQRRGEHGKKN